jgi:NDP-sugar pyrophosphorylase family protein
VVPALLEADVPFYSHEIEAYWNDIGNLDELREGNLDALRGAVAVEPGAPEVAEGVRSASPLEGVEAVAPVLVGERVEIGEGTRIEGPAIVSDGCRIGAGSIVRDAILLAGAELPAESILIGGIAARGTKP